MVVTWTPLSLPEARGFVSHYTVAYSPLTTGKRRQEVSTTFRFISGMNASSAMVNGLEPETGYYVKVSGTTGAGEGVFSKVVFVPLLETGMTMLILCCITLNICIACIQVME